MFESLDDHLTIHRVVSLLKESRSLFEKHIEDYGDEDGTLDLAVENFETAELFLKNLYFAHVEALEKIEKLEAQQ